ncbi:MAG: AMP-binding protein, partial [Promethearchaeota archaeon]
MSSEKSPYTSKIWLKSYDDFVPPEVEIDQDLDLAKMLRQAAKEYPESLCYDFMGTTDTYRNYEQNVISFANFLIQNGIKKGDRVAIHIPNTPQYMIALFGAFYAGCTVTGISFLLKPIEIIYQLKDSGSKVIVTLDSFYDEFVEKALRSGETDIEIVVPTNITDMMKLNPILKWLGKKAKKIPTGKVAPISGIKYAWFNDIMEKYSGGKDPNIELDPEKDIAFLQYTGGTTGPPKGAILTHRNQVSNLTQTLQWTDVDAKKGEEIFICAFPFFHIAGMALNLGSIWYSGMQILVPDPRDINHYIKNIKKWKPSLLACVPTLYLYLMNEPKFRKLDLSSLRGYISGAAPFASETFKEFESIVGKKKIMELYGMSETSPILTSNPYHGIRKIGTVGLPIPNTEMKIVDVEDRNKEMPLNEPGEIVVRGPQVFKGYWNKPEETKKALVDGWFFTGDVGVMDDDGFLRIVDRTKDMIIVSGYKVFSVEVDDKMSKHPAIEMCSTIGIPNPEKPGSELVKLFVMLKEGYPNNEKTKKSILKFAKENLSAYKVPKIIEISEDIP